LRHASCSRRRLCGCRQYNLSLARGLRCPRPLATGCGINNSAHRQRSGSDPTMSVDRPKLAAIVTTYFKYSHAQHIVDRLLYGYGWMGTHHSPPMDLVALYVDQVGKGDLSRSRGEQFPSMRIYPTIAEALTRGGSKLAVDGVVVVGEHGDYPRNEKGQTQYPRWEFFQ